MANTLQITKFGETAEGNVTLHVFLGSDGVTGDFILQPLFGPADCTPPLPRQRAFVLQKASYELAEFSVTLYWDVSPGDAVPFWTFSPSTSTHQDWCWFNGIPDFSDGSELGLNSTGRILISTFGMTGVKNSGAFVLRLRKCARPNPQLGGPG